MSNIEIPWEIEGVMTPEQSVSSMIPVIESRGIQHSGTFWTWEGKVNWDPSKPVTMVMLTCGATDLSVVGQYEYEYDLVSKWTSNDGISSAFLCT